MAEPPAHWKRSSWEQKARENPLYAVMTTDALAGAATPELREAFFAKGQRIYERRLARRLRPGDVVFEYGCGVGRILRAVQAAGHPCIGADISPTMLEHARENLGGGARLCVVGKRGECEIEDGAADFAFSYAVLQHIASLTAYRKAISEMCRILRPGGHLVLQVNCEDLTTDPPGRTVNHETHSIHHLPGGRRKRHDQDQWSGVYIGRDLLVAELERHGCRLSEPPESARMKPRSVWFAAQKDSGF